MLWAIENNQLKGLKIGGGKFDYWIHPLGLAKSLGVTEETITHDFTFATSLKSSEKEPNTVGLIEQGVQASSFSQTKSKKSQWDEVNNKITSAIKKIDKFCSNSKYHRSELCKSQVSMLCSHNDEDIPNYVVFFSLKLKPRKGAANLFLDIRGKQAHLLDLKKLLKCPSGRLSLGTSESSEAIKVANKKIYKARVSNGLPPYPYPYPEDTVTLNDVLMLSAKKNNLNARGTLEEMKSKVGFWSYICGDVNIKLINHQFIVSILDAMHSKGMKGSTRNSYGVELRKSLNIACGNTLIPSVPIIPSIQSNRRYLIELPWNEAWLPLVRSYSSDWQEEYFLMLLWHTGQRQSNVKLLKFSQLQLNKRLAHIPSSEHKTNKMIDIPLSEEAVDIILKIKQLHKDNSIQSDNLFPDYQGIDKKRWDRAIKEQSLDPNLVLHHVRHYFITDILRNGAKTDEAATAGGYTSTEGMKRYKHIGVTPESIKAVNNRTGVRPSNHSLDNVVNINTTHTESNSVVDGVAR